jgi:hypothetical protein
MELLIKYKRRKKKIMQSNYKKKMRVNGNKRCNKLNKEIKKYKKK